MVLDSFYLSFALAMDAFAVSFGSGIKLNKVEYREVFRIAWHFAIFQLLFFILGYFSGSGLLHFIKSYAQIIASLILGLIGLNMLIEAFKKDDDKIEKSDPSRGKILILLSIATSIDALAAGFGFSLLHTKIILPGSFVFFVTLSLCSFGTLMGNRFSNGYSLKKISEVAGGIILIVLSLKFLAY